MMLHLPTSKVIRPSEKVTSLSPKIPDLMAEWEPRTPDPATLILMATENFSP